jgi:hypothetical protein
LQLQVLNCKQQAVVKCMGSYELAIINVIS